MLCKGDEMVQLAHHTITYPKIEQMEVKKSNSCDIFRPTSKKLANNFLEKTLIPKLQLIKKRPKSLIKSKNVEEFLNVKLNLPATANASTQCQPWTYQEIGVQCNFNLPNHDSEQQCDSVNGNSPNFSHYSENSLSHNQMNNNALNHNEQNNNQNVFDINIVMDLSQHYPTLPQIPNFRSVSNELSNSERDNCRRNLPQQKQQHLEDKNKPQNSNVGLSFLVGGNQESRSNNLSFPILQPLNSHTHGSPVLPDINDRYNELLFLNEDCQTALTLGCNEIPTVPYSSHSSSTYESALSSSSKYSTTTSACPQGLSQQNNANVSYLHCQTFNRSQTLVPIFEESSRTNTPDGQFQKWTVLPPIYFDSPINEACCNGISSEEVIGVWEGSMTAMVQPGGNGSRIPRALPPRLLEHRRTSSAPSKLEQLQAQFQQKLLKEKEEKLIQMYENNARNAIHRTALPARQRSKTNSPPNTLPYRPGNAPQKAGSVRDFFKQRRTNENGWVPLNQNNDYWLARNMRSPGASRKPIIAPPKGRDKSQPLAPIQPRNHSRTNSLTGNNILPNKPLQPSPPLQPKLRQPNMTRHYRVASAEETDAPKPIHQTQKAPLPAIAKENQKNQELSGFQKWKMQQGQKTRANKNDTDAEVHASPKKKSDFSKWQEEHQREERLKNHQRKGSGKDMSPEERRKLLQLKNRQGSFTRFSDDEEEGQQMQPSSRSSSRVEEDIIAKKKQELKAILAKEKAELEKLQKAREKAAAEEEKERERERKQRQAQEERIRRAREAEEAEQRRQEEREEELQRQRQKSAKQKAAVKAVKAKPRGKPQPPPEPEDEGTEPPKIDNTAFYEQLAAADDDASFQNVKLAECSICGRSFAADRLEKHKKICIKSSKKKRKVFDPVKMRTEGTEQAKFVNNAKSDPPPQPKKNNWRKKHEEFMKMMQYNKQMAAVEAAGGNIADLPPPPPTENPDYVQCPNCSRKFNATAAERHIPRCKDINSRRHR